ncbi:MAG: RNB domain-containing ribonuclease [Desertimonas sp.]
MRVPTGAGEFAPGLQAIRDEFGVPAGFPAAVEVAATTAASRAPGRDHADRTGVHFVTLDPATATDLDQAFAIESAGDDLLLRYAIADVGHFVRPGDILDREARSRGVTVYVPDEKAPLYPSVLSEGAASLLPDGPRPAVVFIVRVDPDGGVRLDGVERAVIRSRAKLAYDTARPDDLPRHFAELSARIVAAEERRGAPRVEFPEQEVAVDGHGRFELSLRPRLASEDQNAGMSLATNLAVADALHAAGTGLFRVMAEPPPGSIDRLRLSAKALGLTWSPSKDLAQFERSLSPVDPRAAAFLIAVRRASGGASYEGYREGVTPWHAAMAATYSHATAPLRRLADRYVVEAAWSVANGRAVPDDVEAAFAELPAVMDAGEALAGRVDRAVVDLAEAVLLAGREGDTFDGLVIDEDDRGAIVQLSEPPVIARVVAHRVDPGDQVRVTVDTVDLERRRVELRRVG